jgi:hypothetical protein
MEINAVVEAKIYTRRGLFARLKIEGLPKGSYNFFDIPCDGELRIGDKLEINLVRKSRLFVCKGPSVIPIYADDVGSDAPGVDVYQEMADARGISRIAAKAEVMGRLYAPHDGSDAPSVEVKAKPRSERIIPPHEEAGYDGNTDYPGHIG